MEEKQIDEKKLKSEEAQTILEEPIEIVVRVNKKTLLHRTGLLPSKRVFKIYPTVAGTMIRISELLNEMDIEKKEIEQFHGDGIQFEDQIRIIENNLEQIIQVVILAVMNDDKNPDKKLVKFLRKNASAKELLEVIVYVFRQLDIRNFTTSIVLGRGMNLLRKPQE